MGGIGSGRRCQSGKRTTDDYRKLDVRRLQREGLLTPGQSAGWNWTRHGKTVASIQIKAEVGHVILECHGRSHGDEWHKFEYPVFLERTDCTLGGQRVWFLCPVKGCGRRVAILYGGSVFACRHCCKLVYECQREPVDHRAIRRADTIRARLGWRPGIAFPIGDKPKGMHWKTYLRMMNQYRDFIQASWVGTGHRLDALEDRANCLSRHLI